MSDASRKLDLAFGNTSVEDHLRSLNSLPDEAARRALLNCCGSTRWCEAMLRERPFRSVRHLTDSGERASNLLTADDWKEAFTAHPRIGADNPAAPEQARRWSQQEQAGAAAVPNDVQQRLQQLNEEYHSRFGYIFIVCATGKSAEEMLATLERRLPNDPATELKTAAEEQRKITKLRLEKLVRE